MRCIFNKEHVELGNTNSGISSGEIVGYVETKRSELPALTYDSVEHHKGQEERLEFSILENMSGYLIS